MSAATQNQETTEPDDTNVGLIATVTVVGALLVVSTAAALTALVRTESRDYGMQVGAYANLGTVKRLKAEQIAKLEATPAWSDKSKGLVSMPIERAMGLVVGEISKNPNMATPEPPAAASAQPGTEPAPATPETDKDGKPVPAKEKDKDRKNDVEKGGARGDAKSPVKVEAPKGAPVVPAGAPARRE
jgi:hypothetical protein